jgi:glycosyltransferase involved in cell wall biosynthesis
LDLLKKLSTEQKVSLLVGLSREEIFKRVAAWHVLVLPSRRTRYWREQIGLPILEGLSLGCEIVTTKETALWQWLEDHGHRVLPSHFSKIDLSSLILEGLADTRDPKVITSHLPEIDGRAEADHWLNSVGIK